MAGLFHDTFFAVVVRSVLGTTYFPHIDEITPPSVYQRAIQKKPSASESTLGQATTFGQTTTLGQITTLSPIEDHDDPMNGRARGFGAYDEQEARATTHTEPLPSTLTLVTPEEFTKASKEEGADSMLVTWYGPTDPENPMNWSQFKKTWVMAQVCLLTFSVYFGSAIYTAGVVDVAREFNVSTVASTLGVTFFLLGAGIGPMLWSPMSEMPYIGRMPIYWVTLFFFVVLLVPTALSTSFGMLMAFRFITGFVGSPSLATGGASAADIYSPKKRVYGITIWSAFAALAPVTGPIVGNFAVNAKNWRWTMWELLWLAAFTLVFLFFFFPETSSSNILYRRAKRLRQATGDQRLKSMSEIEAESLTGRDIALDILVRPFTLNFQEPIVLLLNLYSALIYATFYLWFESFPIVFLGIYRWEPQLLGLAFTGIMCGVFIILPPYMYYIYRVEEKMYDENGKIKPEKRMPIAMFASILAPTSLLWFGWSARASVHWVVPIMGSSLYPMSVILLLNVVLNYLADAYPRYAASVLAGNDLMRSGFAAGFPLFGAAMYNNLGVGWASTLLALLSCAFIPIPILLFFYGERIRLASKRAQHH